MPHIKNALIRYRIIDKCIRNKYNPFPTKRDIREAFDRSLFGSIDEETCPDVTDRHPHIQPQKFSLQRVLGFEMPSSHANRVLR